MPLMAFEAGSRINPVCRKKPRPVPFPTGPNPATLRLKSSSVVSHKMSCVEPDEHDDFVNSQCGAMISPCVTSRSEEHTSELQSRENLVCRLLLEKKKSLCT